MRHVFLVLGLILATACAGPNAAGDNGAPEAPPESAPPPAQQAPAEAPGAPPDTAARAAPPPPAESAPQPGPPMELVCQVSCSPTKLRTGVVTLTWAVRPGSGTRAQQEQAVDMSVFPDGFATGAYARLFPLQRGGPFTPGSTRGPSPMETAPRAFQVQAAEARAVPESNRMEVRVEGVEPGLNYFFRVASPTRGEGESSEPVSCTAPVCPADMKPMPQQP